MFNVKVGDNVSFQYVDRNVKTDTFPRETLYNAEQYSGKVLEVRDIYARGLRVQTLRTRPNVERSQYLIVVRLPDNKIKSFYSGRMINFKISKPKGWIRRLVGV